MLTFLTVWPERGAQLTANLDPIVVLVDPAVALGWDRICQSTNQAMGGLISLGRDRTAECSAPDAITDSR